ncbi:hypothetical protein [Paenibacillus illinoisensis]
MSKGELIEPCDITLNNMISEERKTWAKEVVEKIDA